MVAFNTPFHHPTTFGAEYATGVTPTDPRVAAFDESRDPGTGTSGTVMLVAAALGVGAIWYLLKR